MGVTSNILWNPRKQGILLLVDVSFFHSLTKTLETTDPAIELSGGETSNELLLTQHVYLVDVLHMSQIYVVFSYKLFALRCYLILTKILRPRQDRMLVAICE